MSISSKILFFVLIVSGTFFYSHYSKQRFEHMKGNNELVLKNLPNLKVQSYSPETDELRDIMTNDVLANKKGLFVHFWGTWCAPCEVEFPEFINFAKKFEDQNVTFLLVAVNDELTKIKKFLKRFQPLAKNIVIAIDNSSGSMDYFGTVKVPETYLFNSNGKHLAKFVGPQDWAKDSFYTRALLLMDKGEELRVKQFSTNE